MTRNLLTCPEPMCRRAWFATATPQPAVVELVVRHLRRSHGHGEQSALDLLDPRAGDPSPVPTARTAGERFQDSDGTDVLAGVVS